MLFRSELASRYAQQSSWAWVHFFHRSSILTGKYVHNHFTYENSVDAGCNAPTWRSMHEQSTIGAYLHKAGYKTGLFGEHTTIVFAVHVHCSVSLVVREVFKQLCTNTIWCWTRSYSSWLGHMVWSCRQQVQLSACAIHIMQNSHSIKF